MDVCDAPSPTASTVSRRRPKGVAPLAWSSSVPHAGQWLGDARQMSGFAGRPVRTRAPPWTQSVDILLGPGGPHVRPDTRACPCTRPSARKKAFASIVASTHELQAGVLRQTTTVPRPAAAGSSCRFRELAQDPSSIRRPIARLSRVRRRGRARHMIGLGLKGATTPSIVRSKALARPWPARPAPPW